jgi:hypothetical protein
MLTSSFLIVTLNPVMLSVAFFIVMLHVIILNAVMLSVERADCRGAKGRADILGGEEFG